jgi:uncharacterized protein
LTTAKLPDIEAPPAVQKRNPPWKRQLATTARWLHIYLSMASFAVLFFFAVTGITLNHPEWFGNHERTTRVTGSLDVGLLKGDPPDKLAVVEHLRTVNGVKSALSDFRVDAGQLGVSFKGPGYTADTFIDRASGKYELTETRMGLVAVMNDLHKGRDTGTAWVLLIDVSAFLMALLSATGLVLLFFLPKRLKAGLIVAAVGAAACYLVYVIWVP